MPADLIRKPARLLKIVMKHRNLTIALIIVALNGFHAFGEDDLSKLVEEAFARASDNAVELRKALNDAPDDQKEGVRFLIAYMPDRDIKSLSAEFLLDNVRFACRALNEAPWKKRIPKEIFLNDVLPYASINERRDDWREDFYKRFKPLVADADSPAKAAVILNQNIFKMLEVRFYRARPRADQSPYETIEAGMASCTGLSVLLVDACRAVGVPARFAGTPLWANKSGNHSWVEIWDGDWHYTGAAEPAGGKLDRGWFTGGRLLCLFRINHRNLNAGQGQQSPQMFHVCHEVIVVGRLDHIEAAAHIVAPLNLLGTVCRRQHNHGNLLEFRMLLHQAQYVRAVYLGHSDIQQKQIGGVGSHFRPVPSLIQKIQHLLAVLKMQEGVTDTRTPEIPLDQCKVPRVVFGDQDDNILPHVCPLSVNMFTVFR